MSGLRIAAYFTIVCIVCGGARSLLAASSPPPGADKLLPPRYELYFSPSLTAESGARLISSAVTGTGAGEERLFRPLGAGAGPAAVRGVRALIWDAPVAWWFGVALHEAFGHGGRGREFHTSPSVHLGSPWGGRDSYATFDLEGTSSEERLYIYAGGAEANTLTATLLERRAVEGVQMRPIELFHLAANRLVASDYVLRTTPDPSSDPAGFYGEYSGGGDVANYLGLLHELHGDGSGITPTSVDDSIESEYQRLHRQAYWNLLDPGLWWALASALRLTARGDDTAPLPLPHAGRYRFLPVLSAEWTPSGGEASLEWIMAPAVATLLPSRTGRAPASPEGPGTDESAHDSLRPPRALSFIARRGRGPSGAFGAVGAAAEDLVVTQRFIFGGSAEIWHDPRGGLGGGARLRTRLGRGSLRGLYFDVGVKSQGYWIGQPSTPGPFAAAGILYLP